MNGKSDSLGIVQETKIWPYNQMMYKEKLITS